MTASIESYRTQSPWSDPGRWRPHLVEIPPVAETVVRTVSGLFMHPFVASMRHVALPAAAADDREIRSVEAILDRLLSRDASPLSVARAPQNREVLSKGVDRLPGGARAERQG